LFSPTTQTSTLSVTRPFSSVCSRVVGFNPTRLQCRDALLLTPFAVVMRRIMMMQYIPLASNQLIFLHSSFQSSAIITILSMSFLNSWSFSFSVKSIRMCDGFMTVRCVFLLSFSFKTSNRTKSQSIGCNSSLSNHFTSSVPFSTTSCLSGDQLPPSSTLSPDAVSLSASPRSRRYTQYTFG